MVDPQFRDRQAAGKQLATQLKGYANCSGGLVLGLPRGGVPVAYEIAMALDLPLDICLVRKLGVPGHPELAMGAIASDGVRILNEDVVRWLTISDQIIERVAAKELRELKRRDRAYRSDRPLPKIRDRTIILVDDGLASGATMRAAIEVLRSQQPQKIVVAVPVGSSSVCQSLEKEVDQVVCLATPQPLYAIGVWYQNFAQTTDQQVCMLLENACRVLGGS